MGCGSSTPTSSETGGAVSDFLLLMEGYGMEGTKGAVGVGLATQVSDVETFVHAPVSSLERTTNLVLLCWLIHPHVCYMF